MAATVEVTLANIFALSRGDVARILATQGRTITPPDEKDALRDAKILNGDRAIAAMIYHNYGDITSREEKDIIKEQDFYPIMSSSSSLEEGLKRLEDSKKLSTVLQTAIPVAVLGDVLMEYLSPEEVYIHNLVTPNPTLARLSAGVTEAQAFEYAINVGGVDSVKPFKESKSINVRAWERALSKSILSDNYALLEWIANNIPLTVKSWEYAVGVAAQGGKLDVIKWLGSKVTSAPVWKDALKQAALKGHLDIVKWIYEIRGIHDIKMSFYAAAYSGHVPIMEWLSTKIVGISSDEWNGALRYAADGGSITAMEWLAKPPRNAGRLYNGWNDALHIAARKGHIPAMEWLAGKGANDWDYAFADAARGRQIPAMEWLISKGATPSGLAEVANKLPHAGYEEIYNWIFNKRAEMLSRV